MKYDEQEAISNITRHIRFMRRYFNEVVDEDPKTRAFLPELHCAYMDRLNDEFRPHAFDLALAVVEWEDRAAALGKALTRLRFAARAAKSSRTRVDVPRRAGRR